MLERNIKVNPKSELENKFPLDYVLVKLTNVVILKKNFSLRNKKQNN